MAKEKIPVTAATRLLKQSKAAFTSHLYHYEERGGTTVSARELGVDEHQVIKTLVMEDEQRNPLIILMHGDQEVSTKELARSVGVKTDMRSIGRPAIQRSLSSTPATRLAVRLLLRPERGYLSIWRRQLPPFPAFTSMAGNADSSSACHQRTQLIYCSQLWLRSA